MCCVFVSKVLEFSLLTPNKIESKHRHIEWKLLARRVDFAGAEWQSCCDKVWGRAGCWRAACLCSLSHQHSPANPGLQAACYKVILGHQHPPEQADVGEAENVLLQWTAWKTSGKHHPVLWLPSCSHAISGPELQRGCSDAGPLGMSGSSAQLLPALPCTHSPPFANRGSKHAVRMHPVPLLPGYAL